MHVSQHLHNLQVNNIHYDNEHFIVDNTVYHVKRGIKVSFP